MGETDALYANRVIFSIAIVYSESLFRQIRETDQQLVVSIIAIIFAVTANHLSTSWAHYNEKDKRTLNTKSKQHRDLWVNIVTQWLQIAEMTLTFIAIHILVDVVNTMIDETERYYYESALFPIITLMFAVSVVAAVEDNFSRKTKQVP